MLGPVREALPMSDYVLVDCGAVKVKFSETWVSYDLVHWYVWHRGKPMPRPMPRQRSRYRRRRKGRT